MVHADALVVLISHLNSTNKPLRYNVIAALCGLSHGHVDVRVAMGKTPGFVQLVSVLGNVRTHSYAAF
jgi:hypothetical protein